MSQTQDRSQIHACHLSISCGVLFMAILLTKPTTLPKEILQK